MMGSKKYVFFFCISDNILNKVSQRCLHIIVLPNHINPCDISKDLITHSVFSSKSKILPSRPQTQKAGPSLDLQPQDLDNLQRPFHNAAAQNYRASDPIKRFGSEISNIKGVPSLAQETQHHPLTHSGVQGVLSKESLQGPHIQDLNMVALQQQQQVLVKPLKPLARLKSSSTKATTTTTTKTTTKVVPTFWFNTTKTPTTTKTTSSISTIMESKQQLEAFGGGPDFKYPAEWKNKIPRFPYVPLPKVDI